GNGHSADRSSSDLVIRGGQVELSLDCQSVAQVRRPGHRWSSAQRRPWTYPKIPINCDSSSAADDGASENSEGGGRSKGDGRLCGGRGGSGKAPAKCIGQGISGQILGPSGNR